MARGYGECNGCSDGVQGPRFRGWRVLEDVHGGWA